MKTSVKKLELQIMKLNENERLKLISTIINSSDFSQLDSNRCTACNSPYQLIDKPFVRKTGGKSGWPI